MPQKAGRIACIAWGSLVYAPGGLPCEDWADDGPMLPIEFARESGGSAAGPGDRVTLVICPSVARVRTYWTALNVDDLDAARQALGIREYSNADSRWIEKNVGFWDGSRGDRFGLESDTISDWAKQAGFRGAVWANLDCGLKGRRGKMPGCDAVMEFLRRLVSAGEHAAAEKYVRCAPLQIATGYRRVIEQELGWYPRTPNE